MAEIREPNERYALIARELIESDGALAHIKDSGVRIAYLSSDSKKTHNGKVVFGQCEKVPAKYRWCVPYDFTVTVFEPNVEGFDAERIRILLLHELLHVGVDADGGEESYFIVPHDIEEFSEIVDRHGSGWWRG